MKLRAALVGCGQIGSLFDESTSTSPLIKTHAKAYSTSSSFELVAVCDRNLDLAKRAQTRWNVSYCTSRFEDLFDLKLDVVSLCTPPEGRVEMVRKIAAHGIPLIFCEKPLGKTYAEVKEICDIVKSSQTRVLVNYIRRFDDEIRHLRDAIAQNGLGALQKVVCHYGKGLMNNGSHAIDLMLFLLGRPKSVQHLETCMDDRVGTDDPTESVLFHFEVKGSHFPLFLLAQNHNHYTAFEWDLFFEMGRVVISNSSRTVQHFGVVPDADFPGYRALQSRQLHQDGLMNTFSNAMLELYELRRDSSRVPSSRVEDSLAIYEIIEAARESRKKGGKICLV